MQSPKEVAAVAAKKERIRNDPYVRNICKKLGITMDRLLDGIEEQWANPKLTNYVPDKKQRKKLLRYFVDRVRVNAARAHEQRQVRTHRRSTFGGLTHESREETARRALGDDY